MFVPWVIFDGMVRAGIEIDNLAKAINKQKVKKREGV